MNTTKKQINICGLISFIGYFVSAFLLFLFAASKVEIFFILTLLLAVTSTDLGIIAYIERKKYELLGITVAGFVLNINLFIILFTFYYITELAS